MQYYQNFSLKNYNSFHLDSIAKEIYFPESIGELKSLLIELKGQQFNVLSYGTNILLNGTINKIICLRKMPQNIYFNNNVVEVDTNVSMNKFVLEIIKHNFKGTEGLIGIPGSIGAAIYGNSGSGNYCISDYLFSIITIDYNGNTNCYNKIDLKFERRYSILQDKKEIVLSAIFEFDKLNPDKEIINNTINFRKTLPKYPSAGGIFSEWHELKPYSDKLIGLKVGDAEVSEKVNIIVNKGNATYNNIISLIIKIVSIVKEPLELEVKIFGDKP